MKNFNKKLTVLALITLCSLPAFSADQAFAGKPSFLEAVQSDCKAQFAAAEAKFAASEKTPADSLLFDNTFSEISISCNYAAQFDTAGKALKSAQAEFDASEKTRADQYRIESIRNTYYAEAEAQSVAMAEERKATLNENHARFLAAQVAAEAELDRKADEEAYLTFLMLCPEPRK